MTQLPRELDAKDRQALESFTDELQRLFGGGLIVAALVGEAASACYRPKQTALQTVVVLDTLSPERLRTARPALRGWARQRIPTPLFLDPGYLEGALDTFPLEFREIADFHVVLHGDPAYFSAIRIDRENLRLQVEEQLRGKLLHLWEHYLVAGGRRRELERLLVETLPGFEVPMRGLLRLRDLDATVVEDRPVGVALIEAVAATLGLELPTLKQLEASRVAGSKLPQRDLDPVFEGYLDELRAIIDRIDAS